MSDNRTINNLLLGFLAILAAIFLLMPLVRRAPQVIVNMPADAKPLSQLTQPGAQVIGSDRAVLWYTVFVASCDHGSSPERAIWNADAAVQSAYGPAR